MTSNDTELGAVTEAGTVADLAARAAEPHPLLVDGVEHWVVPEGHRVEQVDDRRYAPAPDRKRGRVALHDGASFAAYVEAHQADGTVIYGDVRRTRIQAIINDHPPGPSHDHAGWGDHVAVWDLVHSAAYQLWTGRDGRPMPQLEFAEFVEDNAPDIISTDDTPSAVDMLEIAQTLEAKKSVDFKSTNRLHDGRTKLLYDETTEAKAGQRGELTVPERFAIAVPVFDGMDPWQITARFRYRIGKNDGLTVAYRLERLSDVIEAAFRQAWESVSVDGVPSLLGVPPDSRI